MCGGNRKSHGSCVDAWLERAGADAPPEAFLSHFEDALRAVWVRAESTLGEVTLTAIADRVLSQASERFPLLAGLEVEMPGGIHCRILLDQAPTLDPADLRAAVRYLLVNLLTVIGRLTAQILTPALHAKLSKLPSQEPSAPEREASKP